MEKYLIVSPENVKKMSSNAYLPILPRMGPVGLEGKGEEGIF